jgi:outer membrane protein assembly factor BamB
MKLASLGKVDCRGGADAGALLASRNRVAVVMRWRETITVACLDVVSSRRTVGLLWQHALKGNIHHRWSGHETPINIPTILAAGDGNLYAVGGTERLLLDGRTGDILAQSQAIASPTAPAVLLSDALVVPEGQAVAAYDPVSLKRLWRKSTPPETWAFAPYSEGVIPVQDERSGNGALWRLQDDRLCWLQDADYPLGHSVVYGALILVPFGPGAAERIIAFDLQSGTERWRMNCPREQPLRPPAQGPFPVRKPVIAWRDRMLAITARGGVEARAASDGRCIWQLQLAVEPSVLALHGSTAWVGAGGQIVWLDAVGGAVLDEVLLPAGSGFPSSIIPLQQNREFRFSALVITAFGDVYLALTDENASGTVGATEL